MYILMNIIMNIKFKFAIAVLIVIFSLVLGAYTKVMMILHFHDTFKFWLNLILYVTSWLMLFVAAFFVGKEAVKLADQYIKKKMQETYDTTVDLHKKGHIHMKNLTKKGINMTAYHISTTAKKGIETTKHIHRKTIDLHKKFLK